MCKGCKKGFSTTRSRVYGTSNSSANFCNRPCYEGWLCQTDRVSGRGSRWTAIRREAIRAAPFCGMCGTGKRLEVHHIAPFRLSHDNRKANLIPLCKSCHKSVETITHDVEVAGASPADMTLIIGSMLRERQMATAYVLRSLARG